MGMNMIYYFDNNLKNLTNLKFQLMLTKTSFRAYMNECRLSEDAKFRSLLKYLVKQKSQNLLGNKFGINAFQDNPFRI